jgi:hypothetical protein
MYLEIYVLYRQIYLTNAGYEKKTARLIGFSYKVRVEFGG